MTSTPDPGSITGWTAQHQHRTSAGSADVTDHDPEVRQPGIPLPELVEDEPAPKRRKPRKQA